MDNKTVTFDASQWQPIETAPTTGRTLLLGYHNSLGNWRTVRGQWMSEAYIEQNWDDPEDVKEGWFETAEEADDVPNCWRINPTHWMPLPLAPAAAPTPAAQSADSFDAFWNSYTTAHAISREAALEVWAAAQSAGQEAAGWRSVDDGLPEPETDVLVRKEFGAAIYHDIAGLFDGVWMSQVSQDDCKFHVTHWMPLPSLYAAPVNGAGQEAVATVRDNPDDIGTIIETLGERPLPVGTKLYAAPVNASEPVAYVDVLFDGPPSNMCGRFVEAQDQHGKSINAGQWIERDDGLWALRIAAPVNGGERANLEGLRTRLLDGRRVTRDADGWYCHPALPALDENIDTAEFLKPFGIEATWVSMQDDDSADMERYSNRPDEGCPYWTPRAPDGDGWTILSIHDHEDGPFALFVRRERTQSKRAADTQQVSGDARAKEVAALAPILRGMIEGGSYDDPAELYAADFEAPDGDVFVRRAADLLEEYAALTSPAKVGGDERERFETWAAGDGYNLYPDPDDVARYGNLGARFAWYGWQARAALSADGGEDKRDAERYRWAIGFEDNAETLHSIMLCHAGDTAKINDRVDSYMAAAIAANQSGKRG